ncbi:MAG: ABC transporter substrate-binding protein [Streptococcaceae bacterium]|jgi:iron complex transport system substrate-binding protein|nr:ABC transporter substrate-binding protein [Streptococcaceae bacterium]
MKKMKKLGILMTLSVTALALVACGSQKSEQSTDKAASKTQTSYPLTIKNFKKGAASKEDGVVSWPESTQTFTQAPKKVVVTTRPMAELLLHLGLEESIAGVGAVFGDKDTSVEKEFDKLKNLGESYISQETALSVDPDFVFGRGDLFEKSEWGVGTVESLNEMNIPTYIMKTSTSGGTFDSIYEDIDHLGQIFDVKTKADSFKAELKEREAKLKADVKSAKKAQTFSLIFSNDPDKVTGYALTGDAFSLSLFKMVGLKEAYDVPSGEVSTEAVIEADPDVLIIPKWGESDAAQKMADSLYTNEKVSGLKAVKNKQIYVVDYNYMWGYSYQSLAGFEAFAKELYPELAK